MDEPISFEVPPEVLVQELINRSVELTRAGDPVGSRLAVEIERAQWKAAAMVERSQRLPNNQPVPVNSGAVTPETGEDDNE